MANERFQQVERSQLQLAVVGFSFGPRAWAKVALERLFHAWRKLGMVAL